MSTRWNDVSPEGHATLWDLCQRLNVTYLPAPEGPDLDEATYWDIDGVESIRLMDDEQIERLMHEIQLRVILQQ